MCGLVGVVSRSLNGFGNKERDIFDQMLFIDTLRGDDSTGTMLVDNSGNVDLIKEATEATYFTAAKEYKDMGAKAFRSGAAMIGHNRKATRGVINDDNAHPFVVDDRIVLMHNGTLYGDHKKIADTEVDSHAIAHLIHRNGDDVEAALKEINGAYALIWYDVHNRSLNFVRNADRPLCYAETYMGWFWASEPGMLDWILARNQLALSHGKKVEMLPAGTLFSFKHNGRTWEAEQRKLDLTKSVVTSYPANDSCAFTVDKEWEGPLAARHPYANGWINADDYDDDEVLAPLTPSRTQQHMQRSPMTVIGGPASAAETLERYTIKTSPAEQEMCRKQGCIMSVDRFQTVGRDIELGTWIAAQVFDYDYVRGGNAMAGLYLYAQPIEYPDAVIRCMVKWDESDNFEMNIINLATAEKKCMFLIRTKAWHKMENGATGEGYCVLYATEYGEMNKVNTGEYAHVEIGLGTQ